MGPDVETYFQEVLATLEQSAEESGRGERGAPSSRLQQLYSEIADAGRTSLKRHAVKKSHVYFSGAQLLPFRHDSSSDLQKGENHKSHSHI